MLDTLSPATLAEESTSLRGGPESDCKTSSPAQTRVAYLVNQYPKISHTFVRREVAALERLGVEVERFSIRRSVDELLDTDDLSEAGRTDVLLDRSVMSLFDTCVLALRQPASFVKGAMAAFRLARKSSRGFLAHAFYLIEACILVRKMKSRNVTHVHAHFGTNSATVALLCSKFRGMTFSFTVHGPEEFDKPYSIGLSEKIAAAKFVVAISEFGRSQLFRWSKVEDWQKIRVVHCVVDNAFFDLKEPPAGDSRNLVCVGRLCEQKGQLLLVEAAAQLAAEDIDFRIQLVGDGELREPIEARIKAAGLEKRVEILGWKSSEEIRDLILRSRTFVLPSFAEGLPVAIMEALALGRPVISTYVAGIPELVNDRNGWLVPAGSVDALVGALKLALESDLARLTEMGNSGAADVKESHYDIDEAAKLAELFVD